jgi:hypothetical protein
MTSHYNNKKREQAKEQIGFTSVITPIKPDLGVGHIQFYKNSERQSFI